MTTLAELQKMQAELHNMITKLAAKEKPEVPAKRPSARRGAPKLEKPAKKRGPDLAKFAPVDNHESIQGDAECACSYHQPDGDKIGAFSVKLCGRDELLISWCPEHECAHYFLGQPTVGGGYVVHEIVRGMQICTVKATPSGDMDTETALEKIEERLGEYEDEDDEESLED